MLRVDGMVLAIAMALAAAGCSSSSTTGTTASTSGSDGSAGAGLATTATTSMTSTTSMTATGAGGSGGSAGAPAVGGAAGAGLDAALPPNDAASTCSGETPAGTAMCGAGKSCHLTSCGPPPQHACFQGGTIAAGAACASSAECAVGLNCIGYGATVRVCEKQCTSDADCMNGRCVEYTSCSQAVRGSFCLRPCTDVTAAGAAACGTGFKCDGTCVGQTVRTLCLPAGTLRAGGACMGTGDCAAGYTCVSLSDDGGATGVCTQTCATNTDCTTGTCTGTLTCGGAPTALHFCL